MLRCVADHSSNPSVVWTHLYNLGFVTIVITCVVVLAILLSVSRLNIVLSTTISVILEKIDFFIT